ncbi:MAG: hypothetical protein JRE40_00115 [Deltaproteobacteria bacterium]|nr:hypothetical protein [Deltaproteobacteria bacterium]
MTNDNEYDVGNMIRVHATFKTLAGVLTDPTSVSLSYQLNDEIVIVKSDGDLENPSTGYYYYDIEATDSGVLEATFAGTGAVFASGPTSYYIKKSKVF